MGSHQLKINLLGTSFTIQSDESQEYMDQLLRHYKKKVEETRNTVGVTDPLKLSILSGLFLVDDLYKAPAGQDTPRGNGGMDPRESAEAEKITRRLIENMERELNKY